MPYLHVQNAAEHLRTLHRFFKSSQLFTRSIIERKMRTNLQRTPQFVRKNLAPFFSMHGYLVGMRACPMYPPYTDFFDVTLGGGTFR